MKSHLLLKTQKTFDYKAKQDSQSQLVKEKQQNLSHSPKQEKLVEKLNQYKLDLNQLEKESILSDGKTAETENKESCDKINCKCNGSICQQLLENSDKKISSNLKQKQIYNGLESPDNKNNLKQSLRQQYQKRKKFLTALNPSALKSGSQQLENYKKVTIFFGLDETKESDQNSVFNAQLEKQSNEKILPYIIKAVQMKDFYNLLNFSNNIIMNTQQKTGIQTYKAWIGRGNNGMLVRGVLKKRWWWQLVDKSEPWDDLNMVWMQWRRQDYVKHLGTIKPLIQEEIQYNQNEENTKKHRLLIQKLNQKIAVFQAQSQVNIKKKQNISLIDKNDNNKNNFLLQILSAQDSQLLEQFSQKQKGKQNLSFKSFLTHIEGDYSYAFMDAKKNQSFLKLKDNCNFKLHNHIGNNFHLSNKNALFHNMKKYYSLVKENVFDYLPLTFHIKQGDKDPEFKKFTEYFQEIQKNMNKDKKLGLKNIWIIKPGEASNRGNGIQVSSCLKEITKIVSTKNLLSNGKLRSFIVQKYIEKPLLYNKRKFDIRCFILVTYYNENVKAYWYNDGYIRTSSKEYSLKNLENKFVHLTNDAVQIKSDDFGKYENGNKISFQDFQKFLDQNKTKLNFMEKIYPQMKKISIDTIKAVFTKLEPSKKQFSFELFGLDYMICDKHKVWLIEVNENPCLVASGALLSRMMPQLVEQVFRIAVDPIFPPPTWPKNKKQQIFENMHENNKFHLVFDQHADGKDIQTLIDKDKQSISDQELEYEQAVYQEDEHIDEEEFEKEEEEEDDEEDGLQTEEI
ncbi:hypothetical protein PPERSA_07088 [Pseudocohnilembus persalinus]|uniref:Tubulin-tyrosine ligase family protein n=1 Tax=Pseudocohnilembus persalinus TaxID=266149 RepID=A0A0V0QXU6_PSEPJ|nr:hypothetical protein PPERSA_07088 [Pseudocohnilembus persalinus]|eukprot:KRX06925.1 hypothetical protein PPERSA_07088 [Pseudocohnilembus persalinus]